MEIYLKLARFFGLQFVKYIKTENRSQNSEDRMEKAKIRKSDDQNEG
jgi:hypothetical protein